ncbi:hypothetical protein RR46_01180 [Papilio xuthus]|uniref:Uncharacterized protein n=1 Tax=Papilio xuthus TaxID=66420 RepID=A0A0N1PEE6_PAPXU|nr:hypothetical protein RR46_01180 [Papilio xuthus]
MSDNEEPSAKHFKLQSEKQEPEDAMEEGHEEWLSEDVLSEDDYYQTGEQEQSDYAIMSQDDTMTSVQECAENSVYHDTGDSNAQDGHERDQEENIEETLNNLENSQDKDFPDELGAFLIRKTDGKPIKKETEERESEMGSNRHTDDDGHDTDELLRMLGEDEAKRKKKPGIKLIKKEPKEESSDEDDDFIFGSTKVTRVKVAKNYIKKYATKAEPEDMSDKDESTKVTRVKVAKNYIKKYATKAEPEDMSDKDEVSKEESKRDRQSAKETEEIINEEEFLDEDEFDLDEVGELETDDEEGPSRQKTRQKIMRPERMDEEVPSDGESNSDESLYDEIQSSESEDLDEWFTLDIRAERAGDYLPLLGSKAKQLLIKERNRVGARLATLDQSLLALRDTGRQQAIQLRRATAALHHIDNALRAL